MSYANPGWINNTEPYINADNLNNMSDALESASETIGESTLTTTAQTLTDAVNELDSEIGNTSMGTTASTVKGAIAEIKQTIDDYPDFSSYQTSSTTWITPTIYQSNCVITQGGYFVEGKHVYIEMRVTLTSKLTAGNTVQIVSGLPNSITINAPVTAIMSNRGGYGVVMTTGGLVLRAPDHDVATTTAININGHYVCN